MEIAAPDRTETSNGRSRSPNLRPISSSIVLTPSKTRFQTFLGKTWFASWKAAQTSVVTVNPGGTERPIADISAKFAPFPPRRNFKPP